MLDEEGEQTPDSYSEGNDEGDESFVGDNDFHSACSNHDG